MPELQPLRADHAPAVLAFETANRAYFATSISDRGDEYFEHFTERYAALLADQDSGAGAYYVLVAEDRSVLGRFNLILVGDGVAELGYRVAQHAAGRGVATATVREMCSLAASRHGVRTLRAATSDRNVASRRVLLKAGFHPVGPAGPADLGGKHGTWYERDVVRQPGLGRRDTGSVSTRAVDVTVTGRVQGVFFRAACAEQAERLGVEGWVENRPDGTVAGHFEGSSEAVDALLDWCRTGPPRAQVTDVRTEDSQGQGPHGFEVR